MASLDETVNVGGTTYLVSGIPFGQIPVWDLLSRDGKKLTGPEFMSLPERDKDKLAAAVEKYVGKLNGEA